jgi:hypothetical protein
MKQRISTLIEFFAGERASMVSHVTDDEDRQRHGACIRPERLRGRRGSRARMPRAMAHRQAGSDGKLRLLEPPLLGRISRSGMDIDTNRHFEFAL